MFCTKGMCVCPQGGGYTPAFICKSIVKPTVQSTCFYILGRIPYMQHLTEVSCQRLRNVHHDNDQNIQEVKIGHILIYIKGLLYFIYIFPVRCKTLLASLYLIIKYSCMIIFCRELKSASQFSS